MLFPKLNSILNIISILSLLLCTMFVQIMQFLMNFEIYYGLFNQVQLQFVLNHTTA